MTTHCDFTRPASRFGERLGLLKYGYPFSNMKYDEDKNNAGSWSL